MTKEEYQLALKRAEMRTPSLEEFRKMEAYDDNVVWRLPQGHIVNLLDTALEEIDKLKAGVDKVEEVHQPHSDTRMGSNMRMVDPKCKECGTRWPCRTILLMRDALDG